MVLNPESFERKTLSPISYRWILENFSRKSRIDSRSVFCMVILSTMTRIFDHMVLVSIIFAGKILSEYGKIHKFYKKFIWCWNWSFFSLVLIHYHTACLYNLRFFFGNNHLVMEPWNGVKSHLMIRDDRSSADGPKDEKWTFFKVDGRKGIGWSVAKWAVMSWIYQQVSGDGYLFKNGGSTNDRTSDFEFRPENFGSIFDHSFLTSVTRKGHESCQKSKIPFAKFSI